MNKSKKNPKSLESQIIGEDLKEIGKGIIYPTLGINFAFPTMFRIAYKSDYYHWHVGIGPDSLRRGWTIAGAIIESAAGYAILSQTDPKLILPIALTQLGTNIASGVYEYIKHVKEKAEEHAFRVRKFNCNQ